MIRNLPVLHIVLLLLCYQTLEAQKWTSNIPDQGEYRHTGISIPVDEPIVCPHSYEEGHAFFPFHRKGVSLKANPVSNFVATYDGAFTQEARDAFEYAISILESTVPSSIDINVLVRLGTNSAGSLASARTTSIESISGGGLPDNTLYPVALAEKLISENLNGTDFDLVVNIGDNVNWYYDFNNPSGISGQFDFVTVVLHELLHGLGFSSFTDIQSGLGIISFNGLASAYDRFLELGSTDESLTDDLNNNSSPLASALRSNDLFFSSRFFEINSPTALPKVYAPTSFNGGSSISHVDQTLYAGSVDGLMAPTALTNEVIHDPGIAEDILFDMGWNRTAIRVEHEFFTEDVNEDGEFVVRVESDFPFDTTSLFMNWWEGDFTLGGVTRIPLVYTGSGSLFSATIAAPNSVKEIRFFYDARDARSLPTTNPLNTPGSFYAFNWGPDNIDPEISHVPVERINENEKSFMISCAIDDQFTGIDTAYVEYQIAGKVAATQIGLTRTIDQFNDIVYEATVDLSVTLDENDVIQYKIIANDKAAASNSGALPASGFYDIAIIPLPDALTVYQNNFDQPTDDFIGDGFSIRAETDFASPAIHSDHPYNHASPLGLSNFNLTYQLKNPIVVDNEGGVVKYEEVVLVEPGDPGFIFGQTEFWDYVVFEGKKLDATDWTPIIAGYDSRSEDDWFMEYNSAYDPCPDVSPIAQCISTASGKASLYKKRTLNITANTSFSAGDTILVRFRLFSDPAAYGWGWAIDNLNIQGQGEVLAVEDFVDEGEVKIFPNPTSNDFITLSARFKKPTSDLTMTVTDIYGRTINILPIQNGLRQLNDQIDLSGYAPGIYFLTLKDRESGITKKLIKY